jgi:hypothetical protein
MVVGELTDVEVDRLFHALADATRRDILRPFGANIDNPRWPMTVGSKWVYRVTDSSDGSRTRDVIKVTGKTKMIADGIEARVVSDIVTRHGKPIEVPRDWYAQDSEGNVWYFGEHTIEYKHGKPVDNGSWEAGVDGALPGIALPAEPDVGMTYPEEYSKERPRISQESSGSMRRRRSPPAITPAC